jgi:hypothetical protein
VVLGRVTGFRGRWFWAGLRGGPFRVVAGSSGYTEARSAAPSGKGAADLACTMSSYSAGLRGANPKKPLGATPPKNQNSTPPLQWGSHKKIKKRVPHTPLVLMRCARPFSDALAAQPLTLILTLPASHHEDHSRTRHVDRRSHTDSCTIGTRNSLYSAAQHAAKTTVRAHSLGAQTPL